MHPTVTCDSCVFCAHPRRDLEGDLPGTRRGMFGWARHRGGCLSRTWLNRKIYLNKPCLAYAIHFSFGTFGSERWQGRQDLFSQWYPASFDVDGVNYATAEHWMMAAKARLFKDPEELEQILVAPTPANAKALDRQVKNFDNAIWKANARRLVTEDNVSKFTQSKDLGEFLLATGNAVLVEAALWFRDAHRLRVLFPEVDFQSAFPEL